MTVEPLHLPTLMVAAALGIAFSGLMLVMARWHDRAANALAVWGGAMLVSAAGLLIIVAAPLPRPWPLAAGDAVLVLGAGLSWAAARMFGGRPVQLAFLAAGPALLLATAYLGGVDIGHIALTVLLVGFYSLAAAIEIGRRAGSESLRSRPFAAGLAGVHAALQFIRAFLMLLVPAWSHVHSHQIYDAVFLEALLYAIGMLSALLSMMKERAEARSTAHLLRMTMVDELTGLGNRRQFDEALMRHLSRAAVGKRPLAMLMIDVDHFKRFNDTYGHVQGDLCLKAVATAASRVLPASDAIATRYGGEEFAVLLGGTDEQAAMRIAAKIHASVAALAIKHAMSPYGALTISIGVAALLPGDPPHALVQQADWALYVAKAEGRNNTRAATETRTSGVLRPTG